MNWLDICFVAVVGLSVAGGIMRGFAREVLGLVGVIAGLLLAITFASGWALHLERWMIPPAAYATTFILILLGTMILADIAGQLVTNLLQAVKLSIPNRLAGGLFGVARGLLLAVVLFLGLLFFADDPMTLTGGSRLAPWAARGARIVLNWLPEKQQRFVETRFHDRSV